MIPCLLHHSSNWLSLQVPPNSCPLSVKISLGFPCIAMHFSSISIIFAVVSESNIIAPTQYREQSSSTMTNCFAFESSVPSICHIELGLSLSNLTHFNFIPSILFPLDSP